MAKYYIKTNDNSYFKIHSDIINKGNLQIALNPTHLYWCSTMQRQRHKATKFDSYNVALFWQQKLHITYKLMSVVYNRQHCLTLVEKSEANE